MRLASETPQRPLCAIDNVSRGVGCETGRFQDTNSVTNIVTECATSVSAMSRGNDPPTNWDDEAFKRALEQAQQGNIKAPNVRLTQQQLKALLAAAPRKPHQQFPQLQSVDLRGAEFIGGADFTGAAFTGGADFTGAAFTGGADFTAAAFTGGADFTGATSPVPPFFSGRPSPGTPLISPGQPSTGKSSSAGRPSLGGAHFDRAIFARRAVFSPATFTRGAFFTGAAFTEDVHFSRAAFTGGAFFTGATFTGHALFAGATFATDARFNEAIFDAVDVLGPVLVNQRLWLDRTVFEQRIRIVVSARHVSFTGADFRRGADIRLRWAQVWLEDTDFAEESLLTSLPAATLPGEEQSFLGLEAPTDDGGWSCRVSREPPTSVEPRVLTLGGSRIGNLTLSGVNLEECRFATTHGLDDLGLERVTFPESPQGWRWARRQTIAEEHYWRAAAKKSTVWKPAPGLNYV